MFITGLILEIVFFRSHRRKHSIKPVLQVPNECSKELSNKPSKRYLLLGPDAIEISQKLPTVPRENINFDPNLQTATSFSPVALIPTYENGTRIAVTAMTPQQENVCATIEKNFEIQTSSVWLI